MKQAIILAAGLGSRLGSLTAQTPKALIEVDGRPLIDYALCFARRAGFDRRIVVSGYCHADLLATVERLDEDAIVVENSEFRKGNLVSLGAGRAKLEAGTGFLLMNTDHIYRPSIADLVRAVADATHVTAFTDTDRQLTADDMKVGLDPDGHVARMAKTLPEWDCGYVGMTYVPAAHVEAHTAAGKRAHEALGDAIHVESVLVELASAGAPPHIADISGHGWLEVDEQHERDHAAGVLAREQWWAPAAG